MRSDLPAGVAAAQIAHAAGESSPGNLPEGTFAIVLSAPNEEDLLDVADRVFYAGLEYKVIYEPDPPHNGEAMAIGLVPVPRSVGRRILSSLPLYRGPVSAGGPVHGVGSKPPPAPIHGGVAQSRATV